APEQAVGPSGAMGRPTDVYALGCILYELLTGRPPFIGSTPDIFRQLRKNESAAPGQLRPGIPRNLEMICLKCLRKAPVERYQNARALGDDLRRWLAGKPVWARPVWPLKRLGMWVRRRPTTAALITVCLLTAVCLLIGIQWYATARSHEELHQRHIRYATQIARAQRSLDGGQFHGLTELLNGLRPSPGSPDLRGFEWYYLWRRYLEAGL